MPVAQGGWRDAKYRRAIEQASQRPNQLLAGQDRVYGLNGQVPTYDWQLPPKGRPFPIVNRSYIQDTQLVLIGQDRFYGAPGQSPPYEWPVPKGPAPHRENRTFLRQEVARLLAGQDQIYGAAGQAPVYVWIVPKGAPFPLEDRGYILDKPNQLIGQDAIYGDAGQSPVYVWIVPKGPGLPNRGSAQSKQNQLIGQDVIYGAPGQAPVYDMAPPVRAVVSRENRTFLQNLLETVLAVVQAPFNQFDWPVPWGRAPHRENRTFIRSKPHTLIGQDAIYGAPGQAPVYDLSLPPKGRPHPITQRTWLQVLVDKFQSPFAQLDWPVPWGREHRNNRTFTHPTDLPLIGQDQFYGAPGQVPTYDWQNPTPARPQPIANRTWISPRIIRELGAAAATFLARARATSFSASARASTSFVGRARASAFSMVARATQFLGRSRPTDFDARED